MEQITGQEGGDKMYRQLLIFTLFSSFGCSATEVATPVVNDQPARTNQIVKVSDSNAAVTTPHIIAKGGDLCEKYLLEKLAKEKAENGQTAKITAFHDNEARSPGLAKYLETANREKLFVFELQGKGKTALIFSSWNMGATGLAANLQDWFIQLGNHSVGFQSLSKDPKLIFWDKDGLLNYYSVVYSSEFVENKIGITSH